MSYSTDEISIEQGQPVECYRFIYNAVDFTYTSSQYPVSLKIGGTDYVFNPEYIKRSDSLKLGNSNGQEETCTITVTRANSIALLYQGAPPEFDKVRVYIYRVHGENSQDYIQILAGTVSQVTFRGSEAELTITIENVLKRLVPRGSLSYYCQNNIYDSKCTLDRNQWKLDCFVDTSINGGFDGLWVYSTNLLQYPDDYFTDGYMQMGNCFRAIKTHYNSGIKLKYPIMESEKTLNFTVYPGCNALFMQCATKFNNTDNFSGVPYIQPYNAFTHPVDKGAYWIDGNIVIRDTNGYKGSR